MKGIKLTLVGTFFPKFGELIGYLAPGPSPLVSHMSIPRLPNDNEVIHVYCDIVTPSMVGKQCVHMLDIIPSRGVYTKTSVMNMYKRVGPRRLELESITVRMTNQKGDDIPFSPHVDVFAVLHFRQRE